MLFDLLYEKAANCAISRSWRKTGASIGRSSASSPTAMSFLSMSSEREKRGFLKPSAPFSTIIKNISLPREIFVSAFFRWKRGSRPAGTKKPKADASGEDNRTVVSLNDFKRGKRRAAAVVQQQDRRAKAGRFYKAVTTDFYSVGDAGPVLRAPWVSFFIFSIGLFAWSFLHDDVQRAYGGQVWFWSWVAYLTVSAYFSPRLWYDVDVAMMALVAVIFLPCLWFMALWVPAITFILVGLASMMLSPFLAKSL